MTIKDVKAYELLDSRGNPTVGVRLTTENGDFWALTPSGASAGSHEALELRDTGPRYGGKGVGTAVKNVNTLIAKRILGMDETQQAELDGALLELDGTKSKDALGANAVLPVSMAAAVAAAAAQRIPLYQHLGRLYGFSNGANAVLPVPMCNVINGGKHAGQDNDIQEHMIVPVGAKSYSEAIRMVAESYHELQAELKRRFGPQGILIGDEGGFAPQIPTVQERLDLVVKAYEEAGYRDEMRLAIDSASSEFFADGTYHIGAKSYSSGELVDFYDELTKAYPIVSLEDGMAEDDWDGWTELMAKIGSRVQIVGDDLLVTNPERIEMAVAKKAVNSVLIKLNQIGSLTETLQAVRLSHKSGFSTVISHRSGETEDRFIADLAVGVRAGQVKFGAPARTDRNAKYNRLLVIEDGLGSAAKYPGAGFRDLR
ncbi:phosphopyruvate hydratase [Candidatus Woesearchaeota archaeon]|nr:phosphopyruvate hydratase [Candidatus Woesearchaeota archaeon]